MDRYNVTGMSCASCSARVEKAVKGVNGVSSCAVSLLTNSMQVEGTAAPKDVIAAVENAGYGASLKDGEKSAENTAVPNSSSLENKDIKVLRNRLISSIIFLLLLMYVSMGHTMWGWWLPSFFDNNHVAMGLVELLLTIIVMVINKKFFVSGFKSLFHLSPNMDTLVALGASASFLYSLYALFAMTRAQVDGGSAAAMPWMHEFYFESAAMILTLITLGKLLEAISKGKTTDALKGLMNLAPKTAVIERDGKEITVSADEVKVGDIFIVKPGAAVPADGVIVEGESSIDESALTGESIPVDKTVGDNVSAATINSQGYLKCRAEKTGGDTALSQIIQMVSDASGSKAPIARIADKISGVFVPAVLGVALVTLVVWLLVGQTAGFAIARAVSVLVVSCPCALGLATPVAIMVGNGKAAKNGILFKTATSLEETGRVRIVALDKTGTITKGEPEVTDIIPFGNTTEDELFSLAYSLERKSEHPLAKAIVNYANENTKFDEVTDFKAVAGNGLSAECNNMTIYGGNLQFIGSKVTIPDNVKENYEKLASEGKTPLLFSTDKEFKGIIAVADVVREDSAEAIKKLHELGLKVVMLTGDNERTAEAIGKQAGVDQVIAGVLPDEKEAVIKECMKYGKTAMVGDGINDAPALTRADIGIAIGAGTDIAIDSADVVLMKSNLSDVASAIILSRKTIRNIHENLFWAFIYNVILVPIAAGVYVPINGLKMNPMFGAAAMSLSSVCVVTNALRLNLANVNSTKHVSKSKEINNFKIDFVSRSQRKEKITMKKTIKIEGMMCGHCEATVKKALENLDGVESAEVSHEKGTAIVELSHDVNDADMKKAVEDKDYKVLSIA